MILAAGRGERMGDLTTSVPKPLLKVGNYTLIEWQIIRLKQAGFNDLVINLGYLGQQIADYLGDGSRYEVDIRYSVELVPLDTGGGVSHALPLLGKKPFLLTNADIFCDYPYERLRYHAPDSIHLVLVDNPAFKLTGDFSIQAGQLQLGKAFTFAGISVINPTIFTDNPSDNQPAISSDSRSAIFSIIPLFNASINKQTATAEYYGNSDGNSDTLWQDIGTSKRLSAINEWLNNQ